MEPLKRPGKWHDPAQPWQDDAVPAPTPEIIRFFEEWHECLYEQGPFQLREPRETFERAIQVAIEYRRQRDGLMRTLELLSAAGTYIARCTSSHLPTEADIEEAENGPPSGPENSENPVQEREGTG